MKPINHQPKTRCGKYVCVPSFISAVLTAAGLFFVAGSQAAIVGPYVSDTNTLHLWHLDESTAPAVDAAPGGKNMAALGGGAVMGASSFVGFGTALDTSTNISGYLSAVALVNGTGDDSLLTYADPTTGAFTFEGLFRVDFNPANAPRTAQLALIDGENDAAANRPWQWRLARTGTNYQMAFFSLIGGGSFTANLPMTGPDAIAQGSWYHVAVTFDGTATNNLNFYWTLLDNSRAQANLIATGTVNPLSPAGSCALDFSIGNIGRVTPNTAWPGLIDEVRMSKIARSATDMMFAAAGAPVTIVSSPASQLVNVGHPVSFSVSVVGSSPFFFQWRTNGTPIVGATNASYSILSAQLSDALSYDVVVSNLVNSQTSSPATLGVRLPLNLSWTGSISTNWNNLSATTNWDSNADNTADAAFADGDSVTFNDNGAAAPTVGISFGPRSPQNVLFNANSTTYVLTGNGIAGPGGITVSGSSTVVLDNIANSYTGPTTILSGALLVGTNDGSGSLGSGPITNQATLDFDTTATIKITNSVAGTGNIISDNAGNVQLLGSNTFSGNITVNKGTITVGPNGLGSSTNIVVNGFGTGNGSVLALSGGVAVGSNVSLSCLSGPLDNRVTLFNVDGTNFWNGPIQLGGASSIILNVNTGLLEVDTPVITGPAFSDYFTLRGAVGNGILRSQLILPGGNLQKTDNDLWTIFSTNSSYLTFRALGAGIVKLGNDNALATNSALVAGGGVVDLNGFNQTLSGISDFTSGLTVVTNSSGSSDSTLTINQPGFSIAGHSLFADGGSTGGRKLSLVLDGGGSLAVGATNTYAGTTTVRSGSTLILNANGSISRSSAINVLGGSTIDPTFRPDITLTLGTNQVLKGDGALNVLGTLSNTVGTIELKLAKTGAALSNDSVNGLTSVSYGGTLKLDITASPALTTNDSFKLFNAGSYAGAFATINPSVPLFGLAWDTSTLATDGTLRITTSTVATNPVLLNSTVVGGNSLQFNWPGDHTGWSLQVQTNSPGAGISTNWFVVAGSAATNQVVVPINPAIGSTFYRLVYP